MAADGKTTEAAAPDEFKYGHVILNISNSVLPLEKLSPTPSSQVPTNKYWCRLGFKLYCSAVKIKKVRLLLLVV